MAASDPPIPDVDVGGGTTAPAFIISGDAAPTTGTPSAALTTLTGTLVVEDGTGKPDADAYCSVEFATAYLAKFGDYPEWANATLQQQERAIRIATRDGIDGLYRGLFRGAVVHLEQRLQLPRYGLIDDEGRIANNTVPLDFQEACALLAVMVLAGEVLLPDDDGTAKGSLTEETKALSGVGSKTLRYAPVAGASTATKRRRQVEARLGPWVNSEDAGGVTRA